MATKKTAKTSCIILAAGLGTRMKSTRAKVLHTLYDRPMLDYVIDTVNAMGAGKTVTVINSDFDKANYKSSGIDFALQRQQKGTANAVSAGISKLKGFKGTVLILNGDTPLITARTLKKFLTQHKKAKSAVSVLSFMAYDPTSYGRIKRNMDDQITGIVEEKDATSEQKDICEVNSGVYAIEHTALPLIRSIKVNRKKGEYYLTDIIELAFKKNIRVGVSCVGEEDEFMGINSRLDLARAHEVLRARKVMELLERGVSFVDPASVYIAPGVKVGIDSTIYPNVFLHGDTKVGKGCTIYPNTRIVDSTIKDDVIIRDCCLIEDSHIGKGCQVGPMAHLRPESVLAPDVRVGNFVEIKKSTLGAGTKAGHLSYIGDTKTGRDVNVGAGTITCNYDGKRKHQTQIGSGVFIGSDTQLVAPVNIGPGAYIGAGSTITKDVPGGSLSVSRTKQKTVKGWARKKSK